MYCSQGRREHYADYFIRENYTFFNLIIQIKSKKHLLFDADLLTLKPGNQ